MPLKTMYDTAEELAKRIKASFTVKIVFLSPNNFDVIDPDTKKVKYPNCKVYPDMQGDDCACQSHEFGQRYEELEDGKKGESRYEAEHGHPFQCKHLIKAHLVKGDDVDFG